MSLDTTDFDAQIAKLTDQIASAQLELDSDPLQIQISALKTKSDVLGKLQNQLEDIQTSKNKAITIQTTIDESQKKIVELKNTIKP